MLLPERPFKYLFKLKLLFNIFLLYVESSVMICVLLLKRKIHGSGINVIQYSPEVKRKMSSSGALNHSCAISYSLTLTASFISRCFAIVPTDYLNKRDSWELQSRSSPLRKTIIQFFLNPLHNGLVQCIATPAFCKPCCNLKYLCSLV